MSELTFKGPSLLEIRELQVSFATAEGTIRAVEGVSLHIPPGKTIALVGESGCGKSVTALSILRLVPQPPGRIEGSIVFRDPKGGESVELLQASPRTIQRIRGGRIAMIFQEPTSSLNPVFTVGAQIVEAIKLHSGLAGRRAVDRAVELLRQVGIAAPEQRIHEYPHRMSGGMLQRVMIAVALAGQPALLIADEPTTALDVTVQLQVLELLRSLQVQFGMSILLITHDLGVVAQFADEVHVMFAGKIVEHAAVTDLFDRPSHPYTKGLLTSGLKFFSTGIRYSPNMGAGSP